MSALIVRRALRTLVIGIAVAAWIDPSYAERGRPRVAVLDATSRPPAASSVADVDLTAAVRAALEHTEITTRRDPGADAWVIVAGDEEVAVPEIPKGVALSLVVPHAPSRSVVLEALDVPERVHRAARVPVVGTFEARGLKGTSSTVIVRADTLVLGRLTHQWTEDHERFTARLDVVPPAIGVNHLIVEALEPAAARSRRSRGDALVDVDDRALPIMMVEGRPSWTTTFVRRALERDSRFSVTHATRVSRGIVASATNASAGPRSPSSVQTLTSQVLDPFLVAIVGAPEALTSREVGALHAFVRRGGALVIAPDRRPAGAYVSLISNVGFDERLLDDPVPVGLAGSADLGLLASELAWPHVLPPGTRSLARVAPGTAGSNSVLLTSAGAGQTLFVGALDAWRFRGRQGDSFDRWWAQVVEWLARAVPDEVAVSLEQTVLAPGEHMVVRARLRPIDDLARPVAVRASLVRLEAREGDDSSAMPEVVRLWPDAERGTFSAALNAPDTAGVYAVSVDVDEPRALRHPTARAPFCVEPGARHARRADDRWPLATAARGGAIVTADHLDQLSRLLRVREDRKASKARRFPMRSAWWLWPFVACLGSEWWLRRRAGLR